MLDDIPMSTNREISKKIQFWEEKTNEARIEASEPAPGYFVSRSKYR